MKLQGVTAFNTQLNPYLKQERTGSPHVQFVKHDVTFGIDVLKTLRDIWGGAMLGELLSDALNSQTIRQEEKAALKKLTRIQKHGIAKRDPLTKSFNGAILSLFADIPDTALEDASQKKLQNSLRKTLKLTKTSLKQRDLSIDGRYYSTGSKAFHIDIFDRNDGRILIKILILLKKASLDAVNTIVNFISDTNGAMTTVIEDMGRTQFESIADLKNYIKSCNKSKK